MRVVIILVILGALAILAFNFFPFDAQVGVSALALAATSLIIDTAKSKRERSAIAFRKRLASARQYFSDELQRSNPAIDDPAATAAPAWRVRGLPQLALSLVPLGDRVRTRHEGD